MKRTFKMALIASLAVGGSYVLYGSQNKEELSDLALSNVEALTLGTKDFVCINVIHVVMNSL